MRLCEVCWLRRPVARCKGCGRLVCEECMSEDGYCGVCRETMCELCGSRHAVSVCQVCGRRVCEECSVQLDPVVRVCIECYRRGLRPSRTPRRELVLLVERLRGGGAR